MNLTPGNEIEKKALANIETAPEPGLKMFIFFSELQGRAVINSQGQSIAKLEDLKVRLGELFPKVTNLTVKTSRLKKPLALDWADVESFNRDIITLKPEAENRFFPLEVGREEILLKADLLDKQVVDTFGAKIERVNDVHLLIVNKELRIVHVDFGIRGILRRLGWIRTVDSFTNWLFAYHFPDKLVSWKYVQPLASDPKRNLKLNVTLRKLHELHPSDLADILEELDQANRSFLFKTLDLQTAAETLQEVDPKIQLSLIETTPMERATDILEEMEPDEAKDFLAELPEEKMQKLIRTMQKPYRENVEQLLKYEEGTAGSIMTKDFIALRQDTTIAQAIEEFKKVFHPLETVAYLYVIDEEKHLVGVITLRQLLICDQQETLRKLMNPHMVKIETEEKIEQVADLFNKYKLLALPVVDQENIIQGIITLQDIVESRLKEL
jgi:CBS domain-containing protein/sporulation protein YlmC with PRC-barrel domain